MKTKVIAPVHANFIPRSTMHLGKEPTQVVLYVQSVKEHDYEKVSMKAKL
jgi:hypothetical protein